MTNACSPSTDAETCRQTLAEELRPELFRALGDPTRVAILCRLAAASGPLMVSEISDCCGVHLSGVSRHLSTLRDAGVVHAEREGREVRYTLDCELLSNTLRRLATAFEGCHTACCQGRIQP